MRISLQLGYFAGVTVAIMLSAGCSSTSTGALGSAGAPTDNGATTQSESLRAATRVSVLPARLQNLLRPSVLSRTSFSHAGTCPSAPVAFVSDVSNGVVYEIDSSGSVCATLAGFNGRPEGLATDKSGNLYVATTDANDIVELAPPYTGSPITVYADPDGYPS